MTEQDVLAIIPARGGSKGIPGKNIRPLAGRPMIGYTIDAAHHAALVSRVVVTTDDEHIASVAAELGAEVPFLRPPELAQDDTADLPVFQHCLDWLDDHEGYRPAIIVHLRPTAPLRRPAHIDDAVQILLQHPDTDAVRTVTPAGQHPYKMWSRRSDGLLQPFVDPAAHGIDEPYNQPRQALPPAYVQNGSVDVVRADVIRQGSMTGGVIRSLVMDPMESVNVDHEVDFLVAEATLESRGETR